MRYRRRHFCLNRPLISLDELTLFEWESRGWLMSARSFTCVLLLLRVSLAGTESSTESKLYVESISHHRQCPRFKNVSCPLNQWTGHLVWAINESPSNSSRWNDTCINFHLGVKPNTGTRRRWHCHRGVSSSRRLEEGSQWTWRAGRWEGGGGHAEGGDLVGPFVGANRWSLRQKLGKNDRRADRFVSTRYREEETPLRPVLAAFPRAGANSFASLHVDRLFGHTHAYRHTHTPGRILPGTHSIETGTLFGYGQANFSI